MSRTQREILPNSAVFIEGTQRGGKKKSSAKPGSIPTPWEEHIYIFIFLYLQGMFSFSESIIPNASFCLLLSL